MRVITATSELEAACRELAAQPFVAVDTEFMREQTFWPELCLIQLAGPGAEMIVDPKAKGLDLAPFWSLMADTTTVKVFHAARQDIEIVYTEAGIVPAPVFDTQVAAMVCGFGESISYVNLVKKVTGQDLDKSSRFTDWSRRPLSDKQLVYALGDVTHLRDIYRHLAAELQSTGRLEWLNEEMAELLSKCARNAGSCSILDECADVIIVLARLVDYYGSSISEIVNQKMAVNRQRRWVVDGNGHGHHVKDAVNGSSGS